MGKVHGGERQQSMQDIVVCRTNLDDSRTSPVSTMGHVTQSIEGPALRGNLLSPQGEATGIDLYHLVADGCNMVDQSQLIGTQVLRCRRRVDVEAGKGEHPGALPLINGSFDLGSPLEVWLVRGTCSIVGNRNIVVRAANLVLRAVTAERCQEDEHERGDRGQYHWGKFSSHRI